MPGPSKGHRRQYFTDEEVDAACEEDAPCCCAQDEEPCCCTQEEEPCCCAQDEAPCCCKDEDDKPQE
ncbi:MAG: hypothetical protein HFF21_09455 [Oscillospiraceae bacterium]|nr:hypothetical protein [Oscillospiraceae bacterium]